MWPVKIQVLQQWEVKGTYMRLCLSQWDHCSCIAALSSSYQTQNWKLVTVSNVFLADSEIYISAGSSYTFLFTATISFKSVIRSSTIWLSGLSTQMESGYKIDVLMHTDLGKAQRLSLHYEMRLLVKMNLEIFCADSL